VARARVGTSGWSYRHWQNVFYPPRQPGRENLPFFAQHFDSVEINYSYYQLPERKSFVSWREAVPPDFLFAVKASRYLTHMRKLNEPREPVERLLEVASGLQEKLGPVLLQFPRRWALNLDRLRRFMETLQEFPPHRYTFEFRHASWLVPDVYALLAQHDAALCLPVGWGIPLDIQVTAGWTYIRFHGGSTSIAFTEDELQPWAERIRTWRAQGIDSYSYFNNDTLEHGRAPAIDNAHRLRELVGE
jgi:uncharacterized protein YecE (DUF72 family)